MRRAIAAGVAAALISGVVGATLYGPLGRTQAVRAALHSPPATTLFVSIERSNAKLVHKRDFEAVCRCHSSSPEDSSALIWVVALAGQARFGTPTAPFVTHASGYVTLTWPGFTGGGGGFNSVDAWPVFWDRVPDLAWG